MSESDDDDASNDIRCLFVFLANQFKLVDGQIKQQTAMP